MKKYIKIYCILLSDKLKKEVVNYIWENFASILSMTLNEVGTLQPKNHIHYMAHRLIANKYVFNAII